MNSTDQATTLTGQLHASAVAKLRARTAGPCAECGTPMVLAETTENGKDLFTEAAADGTSYGPAADLAHLFDPARNWLGASGAYAYLAELGKLCGEATAVKRTETTWLYDRTIREYAALKVRLDLGSCYHSHRAAREPWAYDPHRARSGDVMPYHCARPAHLRPSGWYCRECGELLTDDNAELRGI
jgi:hypothetical protein